MWSCSIRIESSNGRTLNWVLALLLGAGVQLLALAILLRQLRRWARDLTLPQSRAALVRAMEHMS